jgi:GGDEF domain-containing protein
MTQIFRCLPSTTGDELIQVHDATLYAALEAFPSELAVVNRSGQTVLANHALCVRYGKVTVEPRSVDRILSGLGGECRIKLRCDLQNTTVEVHALAVALRDEYLLVVGDATCSPADNEVTRLRTLVHSLQLASSTDHLTGAWNRAHFDRLVRAEVERSVNLHHPLSLVLLDIDHFKRVNDEHGHLAGDFVLREIVHVIRAQLRRSDELFRWGGEEFAVLPAGCGYRAAERSSGPVKARRHGFIGWTRRFTPRRPAAGIVWSSIDAETLTTGQRPGRSSRCTCNGQKPTSAANRLSMSSIASYSTSPMPRSTPR